MQRCIFGLLVCLLMSCGATPAAIQPTLAPPTTVPTVAPTAIPTLTEYAGTLKAQLIGDDIAVQSVTANEGVLPILTVAYALKTPSINPAEIGPEIERAVYTISKRVASQIQAGTSIDRTVLVLMLNKETKVSSTSINTRDMVAWAKGDLTDQQYQERWSQQLAN